VLDRARQRRDRFVTGAQVRVDLALVPSSPVRVRCDPAERGQIESLGMADGGIERLLGQNMKDILASGFLVFVVLSRISELALASFDKDTQ
jgi:hypothetical protein